MAKRTFFISIGVKLTGMVSLLLGVSLAGLTVLSTWFFSTEIERTLRSNTLERVELLSDKIDTDLHTSINSGRLIAATMEGGLVYQGTGASATNELLSQNENLQTVLIVTKTDNQPVILKEAGNSVDNNSSVMLSALGKKLDTVFAGETIIQNLSPELNHPALVIAFPYTMTTDTEAESVVVLAVSMTPLISALAARELYNNYIVDSTGMLISHTDESLILARPSFAAEAIIQDSMSGESLLKQMQFTDSNGKVLIGSYKRFFNDSLTVVSTVQKDTALAGVYRLQKRNIQITAMILCLSIILLFLFSKSLTNPVQRLMAGAAKIGNGDFSVQIPPTTHDEIGRLSETFNSMTMGLAERDKIKTAFGKFVNKEVAERVLKGDIQLGGESRTAAIFFSDIRSFTAISEKLTPHEVVEFLNDYMTHMVECVNKTQGVVDKFIGDAIMAIWGIPYSHGNDTENAINGALMMRKALALFNSGRGSEKKPIIRIGSGINTGEVIAGQIGSLERMEYTCIGDAVNLASRIESLNKLFKTDILISQHSYSLVRNFFRVEPMKKILVKGKTEPQQIYAVLGRFDDPHSFKSLHELRSHLGLDAVSLDSVNPDLQEDKYEIIE